jgi:hypothetical protein
MDFSTVIIAALLIWVVPVLLSVVYLRRGFSTKLLNACLRGLLWSVLAPFRGIAWVSKYAFDENFRKELELQEELRREYKALEQVGTKFALAIAKEVHADNELKSKLAAAREMLDVANARLKHQKRTRNKTRKLRKQQQKQNKKKAAQNEQTLDIIKLTEIEAISEKIKIAEQKQSAARDEVQKLTEQVRKQGEKIDSLRAEFAGVEVRATLAHRRAATKIAQIHSLASTESTFAALSIMERMEQKVRIKEQQAERSYFGGFALPPPIVGSAKIDPSTSINFPNLSEEQFEKLRHLADQVNEQHRENNVRYQTLARLRSGLNIELTSEQIRLLKNFDDETIKLLEERYRALSLEQENLEAERKERQKQEDDRIRSELKQQLEFNRLLTIERDVQRKAEMERSVREYVAAELERRKLYKETYESTSQKLQVFIDKTSKVTKKLRIIRNAVSAAAANADPSIDRAYDRLAEQLAAARKLMDDSFEQEAQLEQQIKEDEDKFDTVDLQASLKNHRRKNLATEHQLFRVDGIVRRLYMVKVLLKSLPSSGSEELLTYSNVVSDLCSFLNQTWDGKTEVKAPVEFAERITELEQSTLMAFVRIAKVEWHKLNDSEIGQLKTKVEDATKIIKSEMQNQSDELNKWSTRAEKAFEENKELIYFVASQRRDQCREILKVTQQSLDVLDLSLSVVEMKRKPSQAG